MAGAAAVVIINQLARALVVHDVVMAMSSVRPKTEKGWVERSGSSAQLRKDVVLEKDRILGDVVVLHGIVVGRRVRPGIENEVVFVGTTDQSVVAEPAPEVVVAP